MNERNENERMELLARGAEELGLRLSSHQLDQFEIYYRELADWNQRVNLTSIIEYSRVQVRHFLDSLTLCLAVPGGPAPGDRVMEVGAGGGMPGLPLKLAFPEIQLALVESVGKKTAFLSHLVEVLAISDVSIYTDRAEDLGREPDLRERFDLVLARGLAKMPQLLEYTLPFCRVGGRVIAWKHGGIDEELSSARGALQTLGGRIDRICPVEVTGLEDNRILVVVEKVRATAEAYPRRPGVPAKNPL